MFSGCALFSSLKEPRLELKTVEIKSFNFQEARFLLNFDVENPNTRMIPLDEIEYALELNGEPFTQGQIKERIELKPQGLTSLSIPVQIKTYDLMNSLGQYIKNRKVQYNMKGRIKSGILDLPILKNGWVEMKQ